MDNEYKGVPKNLQCIVGGDYCETEGVRRTDIPLSMEASFTVEIEKDAMEKIFAEMALTTYRKVTFKQPGFLDLDKQRELEDLARSGKIKGLSFVQHTDPCEYEISFNATVEMG